MKITERRDALHATEADLIWVASHYTRAAQILTDSEMQAAIIRAQNPAGATAPTEGSTAWSDPTGDGAMRAAATELRARQVLAVWETERREVFSAVAWLADVTALELGETIPVAPANMTMTLARFRWLTVIPQDRCARVAHDGEARSEYDHAIGWVMERAQALRSGTLHTAGGKRCPSVHGVLHAADKVQQAAPPPPKQKPLIGCVSCARDGGHFTPIDTVHHNARSMCRVCGDYASGEGRWLPIDAVRYMHRTGKRLTWKIIDQAKAVERAS